EDGDLVVVAAWTMNMAMSHFFVGSGSQIHHLDFEHQILARQGMVTIECNSLISDLNHANDLEHFAEIELQHCTHFDLNMSQFLFRNIHHHFRIRQSVSVSRWQRYSFLLADEHAEQLLFKTWNDLASST